MSNLE